MNSPDKSVPLLCAALIAVAALIAGVLFMVTRDDWAAPEPARQMANPVTATPRSLAAARALYLEKCANCHGAEGDGHGGQAKLYATKPPDFRNAAEMAGLTGGELFWKISQGRRPMPRFKNRLSEEERWELVNFIRTFAKK